MKWLAAIFTFSTIFAEEPRTAILRTPYGNIEFSAITVFGKNPKAECGVQASVTSNAGVSWEHPVFRFTFSGSDENGKLGSFDVLMPILFEKLEPTMMFSGTWGLCVGPYPPIDITRISVKLESGATDEDEIAAYRLAMKNQSARNAAEQRKRSAIVAECKQVYRATIDRKVSDLTVRETGQVRACQTAGAYQK